MSLTRNQWLEMWASLKVMEKNNLELRNTNIYLPPTVKHRLYEKLSENHQQIQKMKAQVESVIGHMEGHSADYGKYLEEFPLSDPRD